MHDTLSVTFMSIRNPFYSFRNGGSQMSVLPSFVGSKRFIKDGEVRVVYTSVEGYVSDWGQGKPIYFFPLETTGPLFIRLSVLFLLFVQLQFRYLEFQTPGHDTFPPHKYRLTPTIVVLHDSSFIDSIRYLSQTFHCLLSHL